jgi:hypothetical protein
MRPEADAYDELTSVSPPTPGLVQPKMSLHSTAAQLVSLAAEGQEHGGNHESLNPLLTGGAALVILLLLLFVTTRFNRDR